MKRKLFLLFGLCCISAIALAQVKGTVADEMQLPLPGVTVTVKNTKTVTTTDPNGKFSINAPSTATLVFSYIRLYTTRKTSEWQHFTCCIDQR
ncbi:carboxypeptidase-like regulatory domain-containing protein [Pedobacter heparinus]|uniref:carboxypeptidase-like regulatory domain-containing protein n=1 Tax=Pedobacter heparinus TaxID=984 RepID=UPI0001A2FBCF|nr:carboxypeptidase-like regulatory domain-containing protein [Pedobacter heparinus]